MGVSGYILVSADGITLFFSVCVHCIFCIHSSVDGHLRCFHVLAIVESAAMSVGVHVSF